MSSFQQRSTTVSARPVSLSLVLESLLAFSYFSTLTAPEPPKTLTKEWQEAMNERAKEQKMNPIHGMSRYVTHPFHTLTPLSRQVSLRKATRAKASYSNGSPLRKSARRQNMALVEKCSTMDKKWPRVGSFSLCFFAGLPGCNLTYELLHSINFIHHGCSDFFFRRVHL